MSLTLETGRGGRVREVDVSQRAERGCRTKDTHTQTHISAHTYTHTRTFTASNCPTLVNTPARVTAKATVSSINTCKGGA
jgi:hypothetical protein